MEEGNTQPALDPEALGRRYLQAFEQRNLEECMAFFLEESTVEFMGQFRGLRDIEEWHKARFAADLKLVRLNRITVNGNQAVLEGVATSARLRAWRVKSLNGKVTADFDDAGRITRLQFSVLV